MKQKSAYFTKQKTKSKIITEFEKRVATKFNKKNKECIKMEVSKVNLGKGYIDIYNFGDIKLHCYQTNDLMNDESYDGGCQADQQNNSCDNQQRNYRIVKSCIRNHSSKG